MARSFRRLAGNFSAVNVLVTGITGFVGSHLAPRLIEDGHVVRGFARDASRVPLDVEIFEGDAIDGRGLDEAMDGVEVACFLMHAMAGKADGFDDDERRAAENFVAAARRQGVRRVVYLGGLPPADEGDGVSKHLQSRLDVEQMLLEGFPEGAAFRASIVIGPGSRSFEFLIDLVEALPVMALPTWRDNRTIPIDLRDVLDYLSAAVSSEAITGPTVLEIGGADPMSYGDMVIRIGELAGKSAPSIKLPVSLTPIASRVSAALTGEDHGLVAPLMASLEHDLVPNDVEARATFGLKPRGFDEAVRWALSER